MEFELSIFALHISYDADENEPVIQVFGRDRQQQSVCAHVHNVYPYFYLQCPPLQHEHAWLQHVRDRVESELPRNACRTHSGPLQALEVVELTPFYGYRSQPERFCKVSLRNPQHTARLVECVRRGSITGRPESVYEAHIPYISQFMIDYNLYGCGWLAATGVQRHGAHETYCHIEIDVSAAHIANRAGIRPRKPGSSPPSQRHHLPSLQDLWSTEQRRQARLGSSNSSSSTPNPTKLSDNAELRVSGLEFDSRYADWLERAFPPPRRVHTYAEDEPRNRTKKDSHGSLERESRVLAQPVHVGTHPDFSWDLSRDESSPDPHLLDATLETIADSASSSTPGTRTQWIYRGKPPTGLCVADCAPGKHAAPVIVTHKPLPGPIRYEYVHRAPQKLSPMSEAAASRQTREAAQHVRTFAELTQHLALTNESSSLLHDGTGSLPLCLLSMECFTADESGLEAESAGTVTAIFWTVGYLAWPDAPCPHSGMLCIAERLPQLAAMETCPGFSVESYACERDVLEAFVLRVQSLDPDILVGYDIERSSWARLVARGIKAYDLELNFSRHRREPLEQQHRTAWSDTRATRTIAGRLLLGVWRALRSEVALTSDAFEHVVHHVLHLRVPHYSQHVLNAWSSSAHGTAHELALFRNYYWHRTLLNIALLDARDTVSRAVELARVVGIDLDSVYARGSQFKVESLMLRMTRPEGYVLVSPSREAVGRQDALACLPLVMEPHAAFYNDPVIVLDFASMYPSIISAYNICYSTCVGRGREGANADPYFYESLGVVDPFRPDTRNLTQQDILVAPNGVAYVRPHVRRSLLARLLDEVRATRAHVRAGCTQTRPRHELRALEARQLALKLMANVTFGYTSASFSGRMPCSAIADSVVQTGREIVEACIDMVHNTPEWHARVVYGDTDSIFVHLPGASVPRALAVGRAIAAHVTARNLRPISLKMEKVYASCFLLAKKRYVGYAYSSIEQYNAGKPTWDAKGIETVRRDTTPACRAIVEACVRQYFETEDAARVEKYFVAQCGKIANGTISPHELVFRKEVRLGTYATRGPAGAVVAQRQPELALPSERVAYVVTSGAPGTRLADRALSLHEFVEANGRIDAAYYILNTLVPPLQRIFGLVGCDVRRWYDAMPREARPRVRQDAYRLLAVRKICASCAHASLSLARLCDSFECPTLYDRVSAERAAGEHRAGAKRPRQEEEDDEGRGKSL